MNKNKNQGDAFFRYQNKITQAGEYLLNYGFKAHQVVAASQAFLSLMLVESRIVRECRKHAMEHVLPCFNDYGQSMILKGLQVASEHQMTDKQIVDVAERNGCKVEVFKNPWMDSCLWSLLTYAAIGYEHEQA